MILDSQKPPSQDRETLELSSIAPMVVFTLCLALTLGASIFAYYTSQIENQSRFDRAVGSLQSSLNNRMTIYTNALLVTRNLFDLNPNLTEPQFQEFVRKMGLRENFPGIQNLGYIANLSREEALKEAKELGLTAEQAFIGPESERVNIVTYLARLYDDSSNVLGLNLGSSLTRQEAMNRARDTGNPIASSRVVPIQSIDSVPSSYAFLVFVPRYRRGLPTSNAKERTNALMGFIYGGFRMNNLFGQLTNGLRFRDSNFVIQVYDGPGHNPERLMYSDGNLETANLSLQKDFEFSFSDHTWSIRAIAPIGFSIPILRWSPYLVFLLGLLLSIAVAFALRRSQIYATKLQKDIQVRKQTEALLSEARQEADAANRAKSIFLANMSHEIRTPLGIMVGFAELALTQPNPEEQKESLTTIIRNGKELTRIIGDVLDISRIEAQSLQTEKAPFSLRRMIGDIVEAWEPQISKKGLRFHTEIHKNVPTYILSDETRIKQILNNLLSNATKFTSQGSITFFAKVEPLGSDSRLILSVRDTGLGISEEQKERLFKPFSQADASITRRFGGSGLGLALSQELATALGGDLILASSELQGGTLFTLTLPVELDLPQGVEKVQRSAESPSLSDQRILLVEDSPDNQVLVGKILKNAGAQVDFANDGAEGVDKALGEAYDLVLMDIQMPNKDGYTALAELLEKGYATPVIALTAHALKAEKEKALALGFAAYVTKPVDREHLVKVSSEILSSKPKSL